MGTNRIRVAVELETSGTWCGREAGPMRVCCSIKTEVCLHLVNEEKGGIGELFKGEQEVGMRE